MIYGLTLWECAIGAAIVVSAVIMVVGVVGMLWPRRAASGDVLEVELPWHFKVKSNVMAVGVVIVGMLLLAGAAWAASRDIPRFPLTGTVSLDDGRTISGVSVGLIPPEHYAVTAADGTFRLDVPRPNGSTGVSFQAVVYYRDRDRLRAEITPVHIDPNWNARLNHTFGRH